MILNAETARKIATFYLNKNSKFEEEKERISKRILEVSKQGCFMIFFSKTNFCEKTNNYFRELGYFVKEIDKKNYFEEPIQGTLFSWFDK